MDQASDPVGYQQCAYAGRFGDPVPVAPADGVTEVPSALVPAASDRGARVDLLPAESIALTVALSMLLRGETPPANTSSMCILALARLDGRHDWTEEVDRGG